MAGLLCCFWCLTAIFLLPCTDHSSTSKPMVAAAASSSAPLSGNETDRLSLLDFKAGIDEDPTGALRSWDEQLHLCRWRGVTCGQRHPGRVVAVKLSSSRLGGRISPAIANLTFLREINLSDNRFNGVVHQEIGRLSRLRHLNLSFNQLSGGIPANLSRCLHLEVLLLLRNQFTGEIPAALGSLPKLRVVNVYGNHLSGPIPASLGNLSFLSSINLGSNMLTGGIPSEMGRVPGLEVFAVEGNMLSGGVPPSIYNLSKAFVFDVNSNNLSGTIPRDVGTRFPRLKFLLVAENHFHGHILDSLSNASSLQGIDFARNRCSGTIPANLGVLESLNHLTLGGNLLEAREPRQWRFLTSLTNCTQLRWLSLEQNLFEGALPNAVFNFSTSLQFLTIGENRLSGGIPDSIENLRGLQMLSMEENQLTGSLPASLGKLGNLSVVSLYMNRLSGEIPPALCNITTLFQLVLAYNKLTGSIPKTLESNRRLEILHLGTNHLSGNIPDGLSNLFTLTKMNLSHNSLVGSLPPGLGGLGNLVMLDLSQNRLSGELPATIGSWRTLRRLFLDDNLFGGAIPPSLAEVKGLEELDLSLNNLTGGIPELLGALKSLHYLDLSFNSLEGRVPGNGVFTNASGISLLGNPKLCGGISVLKLPACPVYAKKKRGSSHTLKLIIPVAAAGLLLFLFLCSMGFLYRMKRAREQPVVLRLKYGYEKISYNALSKATDGFSAGNLIGRGSFGSVYKGILEGHEVPVAIKVLNCQRQGASKSFLAECEVLKNTRHRNLVKIITVCSSVDFGGSDFRALVFEYMSNGSLDGWLHREEGAEVARPPLDFEHRMNIAIDIASALDYLHNHCDSPIVHCDLKPTNVLLDSEMTAHVSDFGLARFLSTMSSDMSRKQISTIGIKGSVGYIAPEYGLGGPVSTSGDVFGFGILMLELFTGKRPIDDMFRDGLSLQAFVKAALPDRAMDVIDPKLVPFDGDAQVQGNDRSIQAPVGGTLWVCFVSLMRVGLACTKESPRQRMDIEEVLSELLAIKKQFHADAC